MLSFKVSNTIVKQSMFDLFPFINRVFLRYVSRSLLLLELKYIGQAQRPLKLTKYKTYIPTCVPVRFSSIMPPKGKAKSAEPKKTKDNKEKDVDTKKKADKKEESDEEKESKDSADDESNNKNEVEKSNEKKPASRGWGWGHKKKTDAEAADAATEKTQEEKTDEAKTSTRGWGWGHKRKADDGDESKSKAKKKRDSIVDSLEGIDSSVKAKTPDGKEANFKIASWNVNGLRAWLEKDGLEYVKAENPDVFCVQETKCDISKIPEDAKLEGYTAHWLSGDTEGYSGVGIYYRTKPIEITEGIGDKEHDQEGRVITAEFDKFYLVNTYIPNSGRGLPRLDYRTQKWDTAFRNFLKSLDKKKPVVWCGDLNVAHKEIDLKNPKGNLRTAGFTEEERDSFTDTLKEGFFDSFRYLHPKEEHAYTFWTYMMNARAKNAGWRLDYFVLSERLKDKLCDSSIRSKVMGSDHCPIVLQLAL